MKLYNCVPSDSCLTEDAYPNQSKKFVQKQMIKTYCDRLYHDYSRLKQNEKKPHNFQ